VTYAKSLGNGFPIAAIAGKEEVMMTISPGHMAHGGTYSGNVVGTAAASATLDILSSEPVYDTIQKRGKLLMSGIGELLSDAGIPHVVMGVPAMFGFVLGTDQEPGDLRTYHKSDVNLYEHLAMKLIQRGVQPDADGREPWFLCYSLSEEDVARTLQVFEDSLRELKS